MTKEKKYIVKKGNQILAFKLAQEKTFIPELKSYFFKQSKRVAKGQEVQTIEPYLTVQYERIIRNLTGLKIKQDEDIDLEAEMLGVLLGRSAKQSAIIDSTTRKKLVESESMARQELSDDGILFPSVLVLRKVQARIFRNLNKSRPANIAVTETQMTTEAARKAILDKSHILIETAIVNEDVVLAENIAKLSGDLTTSAIAKEIKKKLPSDLLPMIQQSEKAWSTVGDARVRKWHQDANFQKQKTNDPFIVKGELLMFPGDTSLGASMENISRCRCAAVYL